jgi:hypothetical protein
MIVRGIENKDGERRDTGAVYVITGINDSKGVLLPADEWVFTLALTPAQ